MKGYQLKKHFDESVSRFWNASISQIYPTLSDMRKSAFITVTSNEFGSSSGSKIYSITEKGKEELKKWIEQPTEIEPFRSVLKY